MTCPACGRENDATSRFCAGCGASLATAGVASEARKIVTVFFTDVAESTALGERLDPELLRRVMWRYFDVVQGILERHGGTVEKFVGDAVLAIFGVPVVHEDDALRAVRAAAEIRDTLEGLNDKLGREHGIRIATRTGVNTGEVIVGGGTPDQKLATGDAVNVAARLEQAASPGEVLIGAATYAAVADVVHAEPAPPVDAKGKSLPLAAYRLIGLRPDVPAFTAPDLDAVRRAPRGARHVARRLRRRDRGQLHDARDDRRHPRDREVAARPRAARLASGTTRASSSAAAPPTARASPTCRSPTSCAMQVTSGGYSRTSSTGTWPRGWSMARSGHAREEARRTRPPGHSVCSSRRLPQRRPLVVVVDDIHWADPALLDLIEYVAASSSGAPDLRPLHRAARPLRRAADLGGAAARVRRSSCWSRSAAGTRTSSSTRSPTSSRRPFATG